MPEEEEREYLTAKAIEDIEYLKKEADHVRELIRIHISNNINISEIDSVFHIIETIQPDLFSTGSIEQLRNFQKNVINHFTMGVKAFLINTQNDNTQNALIESAKAFNNYTQIINEAKKLKRAKEGEVAYILSKQFEDKTTSLKRPIWSYLALIVFLPIYLSWQNMDFIELLLKPASNEIYWHTIFMLLLTKSPIIFLIFFSLNEYIKAKKLFEEYEHKRIMAATLINNLERLKSELHVNEKDLLELIKVPFEKIFDNPVHSIYGDKSGDKNIGLDQLEKLTSIIEKMKNKS